MTSEGKTEELSRKRASVAALFETHFSRIARYIAVRIGDTVMAEDMASEVFVRALRSVENYKDTGAPMEAWVFRIASNLVVDYHRSRKRQPTLVSLDEEHLIEDGSDLEGMIDRQLELEKLHRAMQYLSEAQREVLALRFTGEMTSEEVAGVMGKGPGAVRQMQSDAIKKLRQILTKTQPEQSK